MEQHFLLRAINRDLSEDEQLAFENWLSSSEKNKEDYSKLVSLWEKYNLSKPLEIDMTAEWYSISNKLGFAHELDVKQDYLRKEAGRSLHPEKTHVNYFNDNEDKKRAKTHSSSYSWIVRIVAVILITIGLNYVISLNQDTVYRGGAEVADTKPTFYELIANKGERKSLLLSDGTSIIINSDSKVRYPKFFDGEFREVSLEGEAYFRVKEDKEKPFKISVGKASVLVTGTEFNIKLRRNRISIVVTSGSVTTYSSISRSSYNLGKGEMIEFTEKRGFSKPKYVNTEDFISWKNNRFVFENSRLEEVMEEIERFYNISVEYIDKRCVGKTLTGRFNSADLNKMLSIISLTLDIPVVYNGKKIIIG